MSSRGIYLIVILLITASKVACYKIVYDKKLTLSMSSNDRNDYYNRFSNEIGVQPPLGFWDPLGILNDVTPERFERLRNVELKHGRIAMLAILGHIVTSAGMRLPGELWYGLPFSSVKSGLAAFDSIPYIVTIQIVFLIGIIDIGYTLRRSDIEEAQLEASGWSQDTINKKLSIELNNGRAAQMGILALMVHEKLDNNPYIINSLLGYPVSFN